MNAIAQSEIERYVEAVRAALADLPPRERDDLLEDLPDHLAEVAAEGGGSLESRLGPPAAYAAELRASAGLAAARPGTSLGERINTVAGEVRRRLRRADVRVGPILGYGTASEFFRLLRPAWWVLRGYLLAMVLTYLFFGDGPEGLLPRIGDDEIGGVLLLIVCVLASIWLGRRTDRLGTWPRQAVMIGSTFVVIFSLAWIEDADRQARNSPYQYQTVYSNPYEHISDVYLYDADGRLLTGVRLFDQNGQPIVLGTMQCDVDQVTSGPPPAASEHTYPRCPKFAPFGSAPTAEPTESEPAEPTPAPSASASASGPAATPSPSSPVLPAPTSSPTG